MLDWARSKKRSRLTKKRSSRIRDSRARTTIWAARYTALAACREATEEFSAAIALRGGSYPDAHYELGRIYAGEQQLDLAISSFQTAISQNENFPKPITSLVWRFIETASFPNPLPRSAPRFSSEAAISLARITTSVSRWRISDVLDEATKEFRLAIEQQPVFPRAFRNLGRTLYRLSDLDGSVAALRTAVDQRDGEFPEAYHDLGLAYFSKGQLDESIGAQRKALEQSKEFAEAHFWLGTAYNAKGEVEKAIEAYNGAITSRRGPYPDAHYNLGLAHAANRRTR